MGPWGVDMSSLGQKSWTFSMYTLSKYYFQQPRLLFPWNEYAYYFGRYPDSIKNGGGLHYIAWYGAQEGSICLPCVKIQNCVHVWWTFAGKELTSWLSACAVLLYAVLISRVPFPYGVWGRKWNSIVSVSDHCLFIFFPTVNYCFGFIFLKWLCLLDR